MAIPEGWFRSGDEPFYPNMPDSAFGWVDGYRFFFEEDATGCSAFSPDLPGLIAAGFSREEVEQLLRDAIPDHLALSDEPLLASTQSA